MVCVHVLHGTCPCNLCSCILQRMRTRRKQTSIPCIEYVNDHIHFKLTDSYEIDCSWQSAFRSVTCASRSCCNSKSCYEASFDSITPCYLVINILPPQKHDRDRDRDHDRDRDRDCCVRPLCSVLWCINACTPSATRRIPVPPTLQ